MIYELRQRIRLWKAKYRSWKYRRKVKRIEKALSEGDIDPGDSSENGGEPDR